MWDGLSKTVVFRAGSVTKDVLNAGAVVEIPYEVVSKPGETLRVGVYGVDAENNVAIPTLWATVGTIHNAANPSGDPSTDPELPVWAQLQEKIEDIERTPGPQGPQGVPGPQGPVGPQGPRGEKGESWVDSLQSKQAGRLLVTILQAALYGTNQSGNIKALAVALGIEGKDKLAAPVIYLEKKLPQLPAPVIKLVNVDTTAVLGRAVLGRAVLGNRPRTERLTAPKIQLVQKLAAPVIRLQDAGKLSAPVIEFVEV